MKIKLEQVVTVQDWDKLVSETYGRPYAFQQQDGCKSRGVFRFKVPDNSEASDFGRETLKEEVNIEEMGVSFQAWLNRDPKQPLNADHCGKEQWCIDLWWERNFYPDVQMVANDLHAKGLLAAGSYTIDIDW